MKVKAYAIISKKSGNLLQYDSPKQIYICKELRSAKDELEFQQLGRWWVIVPCTIIVGEPHAKT